MSVRTLPRRSSRGSLGGSRALVSASRIVLVATLLLLTVPAGLGGRWYSNESGSPTSAGPISHVTGSDRPLDPAAPYALRWLGTPHSVASLSNGYWDNLGQLVTVGSAAYTCYANASGAGGLAPNNLYLLTNASGVWKAYLAGAPLSAMGGDPTCSIALGAWHGVMVEFVAYLSPQNTSNGPLPSVQLIYNPSGSPTGPWVNVSVDPPGTSYEGSIGGNYPDGPSVSIWNSNTVVVTYQNYPPVDTAAASPEVWVESIPLAALPTAPGGQPTEPWFVQIPTSGDNVTGLEADQYPVVTSNPAGVELVFQRGCGCDNGSPENQLAYYRGVVGTDRNVFVVNAGSNNVTVFSATTYAEVASVPIAATVDSAVYDPMNGDVYVTNVSSAYDGLSTVSVISGVTNSIVATITVGQEAAASAYDSSNGDLFVTNLASNAVSVIWGLTNAVVTTIALNFSAGAAAPEGVAYDSGNGYLYVADHDSSNVTVINSSNDSVVTTFPVGSAPAFVAYDSADQEIYVTNSGSDNVSVIRGTSVVGTIPVGNDPWGVTSTAAGELYVANLGSDNVSVIDGATNSVTASIPIVGSPKATTYDAEDGDVLVTSSAQTTTVIQGTTVVATVPVGSAPESVAYDNGSGAIAWQNGTGSPYVVAGYPGSGGLGMSVGFLSNAAGEDFAAYTNSSSVDLQLDAAVGSGTSWSNFSLGSALASSSALYETPGVALGACGFSVGDTMNTNSATGTVVPTVWTLNNSVWTASTFGPTNVSDEVPAFVDVAAQGNYLDTLFVNQPGGGASGTTVFYADQAECTNSTLGSLHTNVPDLSVAGGGSSALVAQALESSGAPLASSYGLSLRWQVTPSSLGTFNRSTGGDVQFTGGDSAGTGTIWVNASQAGWVARAIITVTVTSPSSPPPPSSTNAPAPNNDLLYVGVAVVVGVAAVGGYAFLRGQRVHRPGGANPPPPPPTGPPPT